jgi:PEP-CTERM motif
MKLKLAILASVSCLAFNAEAAIYLASNVVAGDNGDRLFQDAGASSAGLVGGGILAIGYFTGGVPSSSLSDIQTTISSFTLQTSSLIGSASADLGGSFAGYVQGSAFTGAVIPLGSALIGLPVYAFVGNASTLATSTAWALTQVSILAADEPNVQTYVANPPSTAPLIGTIGTFIGAVNGPSATYSTLQLQAVPEPSVILLGGFGVLGLLRRRRN